jgi:hypothetical protein
VNDVFSKILLQVLCHVCQLSAMPSAGIGFCAVAIKGGSKKPKRVEDENLIADWFGGHV